MSSTKDYTPVKVMYEEKDTAGDSEAITMDTTEDHTEHKTKQLQQLWQFTKSKWFEILIVTAAVVLMSAIFVFETNELKAEVAELREKLHVERPCLCESQDPLDKSTDRTNPANHATETQLLEIWTYMTTLSANVSYQQQAIEALLLAQENSTNQQPPYMVFPTETYDKSPAKPTQASSNYDKISENINIVNVSVGKLHTKLDKLKTETSKNISQASTDAQTLIHQLEDKHESKLTHLEELTSQLKKDLTAVTKYLSTAETTISQINGDLRDTEEGIDNDFKQITQLENGWKLSKKTLETATKDIEELKAGQEKIKQGLSEVSGKLAEYSHVHHSYETKLETHDKQLNDLEEKTKIPGWDSLRIYWIVIIFAVLVTVLFIIVLVMACCMCCQK